MFGGAQMHAQLARIKTSRQRRGMVRRRRMVFSLLTACMLLATALVISFVNSSSAVETEPVEYVVTRGESLWTIAGQFVGNDTDIREFIYRMRRLNDLQSPTIHPGQVLLIPTR
jgi:LysM repeat protein